MQRLQDKSIMRWITRGQRRCSLGAPADLDKDLSFLGQLLGKALWL